MTMYYSIPDKIIPDGEMPPVNKTVMFTGHRHFPGSTPLESQRHIGWITQKLKMTIGLSHSSGFTHFISGGAIGIDQLAANLVIASKYDHELTIAVPFPGQPDRWTAEQSKGYYKLLDEAHNVILVNDEPGMDDFNKMTLCYLTRDQWMVDHADLCIAVWDGRKKGGTFKTIRMAKDKKIKTYCIDPAIKRCGWL